MPTGEYSLLEALFGIRWMLHVFRSGLCWKNFRENFLHCCVSLLPAFQYLHFMNFCFFPIVIIPILNNSNRPVFIGLIPSVPQPLWFHLIIAISLNFFLFLCVLTHIRFQQQPCSPWIHLLRCFSLNTRFSFDAKQKCVRTHTHITQCCGSDLGGLSLQQLEAGLQVLARDWGRVVVKRAPNPRH